MNAFVHAIILQHFPFFVNRRFPKTIHSEQSALQCSLYKAKKQRVGLVGPGLELGVILDAEEEGVVRQLHGLDEQIVRFR